MPPHIPPEDEVTFQDERIIPELTKGLNTLTSDAILWYFMNSPFYDTNSNNQALFMQLFHSPDGQATLNSRKLFEERLRSAYQTGRQFVVVAEPQNEHEPWVIQKQMKIVDPATGRTGKIEVEGTYYTQGTMIMMAPSLLDIVQVRLLAVSTHLQDLFDLSKDLSHFSPATGHTYFPPSYELPKNSAASRIGSRAGSPEPASSAGGAGSQPQATTQARDANTTAFSDSFFIRSLNLTETYFSEYMDENPLQGEPGSFVLTNTHAAILSRHEAEEKRRQQQATAAAAAAAAAASNRPSQNQSTTEAESQSQSALPSTTSTPKPGTPGLALETLSRKGSIASLPKGGKEKRRKSKGLASPATPTASASGRLG